MDKTHKEQLKKIKKLGKDADMLAKGRVPVRIRRRKLIVLLVTAVVVLPFVFPPMRLPVSGPVSSGFFIRSNPESTNPFDLEIHKGTDFPVPLNTPVRAAASGIVSAAGWSDTLGNYVIVKHLFGFSTLYGHLNRPGAPDGRFLLRGFSVGRSGSTGRSTGPHLHFEVRFFNKAVPPGMVLFFAGTRRRLLAFVF